VLQGERRQRWSASPCWRRHRRWGRTNESRRVLTEGLRPETKAFLANKGGIYLNGDTHHPHLSFTDGTYDGRYLFVNDKANTRVARIRLDVMRCDKIIELPNQNTVHGMRLQKFPRTGYVFCNGEYEVPIPNDGKILDAPDKYWSIFSVIDGDTMKVAWQVMVDDNLDNTDADYQGKYAFSTCYNSEKGMTLADRHRQLVGREPRIGRACRRTGQVRAMPLA
jgi:nitrous-oxide reductase